MTDSNLADARRRMEGAIRVLKEEFSGLRSGRAHTSLLEPIQVEAYGQTMRLSELATVGAPEARLLTVQVWDQGNVKSAERAIRESDLGLNPITEGTLLRVPLPELTEDRRKEFARTADRYAEQARIAVRNVRQHVMHGLRSAQREGDLSEDEHRRESEEVQKLTDDFVGQIDQLVAVKRQEILQV